MLRSRVVCQTLEGLGLWLFRGFHLRNRRWSTLLGESVGGRPASQNTALQNASGKVQLYRSCSRKPILHIKYVGNTLASHKRMAGLTAIRKLQPNEASSNDRGQ